MQHVALGSPLGLLRDLRHEGTPCLSTSYYLGVGGGPAPNGGRLVFDVCAALCVEKSVSTKTVERGFSAQADVYPKVHIGVGGSVTLSYTFYVARW